MKKSQLVAILFFSGIWGLSETVLGGGLYAGQVPFAGAILTTIALVLLALAAPFVPRFGGATAIGLLAMLYKIFNVPFFGCHLTAIALIGVSWDLVFGLSDRAWPNLARRLSSGSAPDGGVRTPARGLSARIWMLRSAGAVAACYLSHLLFVLFMVTLFRSEHWLQSGVAGGLRHVFVSGTWAAVGCALLVPIGFRVGEMLCGREGRLRLPVLQPSLGGVIATTLTIGIWSYGLVARLLR
jgi:hypothetical protein